MKKKVNLVLLGIMVVLLIVVVFTDAERLDSLFVYSNNNLMVKEVNVSENSALATAAEVVSNESDVTLVDNTSVDTVATPMVVNVAYNDYWAWPTESNYIITSGYGERWGSMHNDIDISGTGYGSNIYAANIGVVTSVKSGCVRGNTSCNGGGGNYIVINHNSNNYYTIYMHLKDIYVSVGQVVTRGQVIGSMGNTGSVAPVPTASDPYLGTHLHFGLYIGEPYNGGYAVNPMSLY